MKRRVREASALLRSIVDEYQPTKIYTRKQAGVTEVLGRLQDLVPLWSAAIDKAIKDIIDLNDSEEQVLLAQTFYDMLGLEVRDMKKAMKYVSRHYGVR